MRAIKPKSIGEPMAVDVSEKRVVYPSLRIDLEHLPEAKKWSVGKNYRVELNLKQTGLHMGKDSYDNSAEFEIHGIKVIGGKPKIPRY